MAQFLKSSKKSFLALLLMAGTALASPDLSGEWVLKANGNNSYPVNFQSQGNSWTAVGRSKLPVWIKLNPSDLQNEWIGDLSLFEKHSVKASMVDSNTLQLKELGGEGHWTLTRPQQR